MSENYSRSTLSFLLLSILWIVGLALLELIAGRLELHSSINQFHTEFLDPLMVALTHLGSGWTFVIATFLLIFVQVRWAVIMLLANLISSGIAQGLKKLVFSDMMRPSAIIPDLHLVEGLEMHAHHTFPSGHSATIFTIGLVMAFGIQNKKLSWTFFVLCAIIAFTRVYLSQHFLGDVAFGSLIGILSALLAKSILDRRFPEYGFYKLPR